MNKKQLLNNVETLSVLEYELIYNKLNKFFQKNYKGNFVSNKKNKEFKFENLIEIKAILSTKLVDTIKIFRFSILKINNPNSNYIELCFGTGENHWAKTRLYVNGKDNPILWYKDAPLKLLD